MEIFDITQELLHGSVFEGDTSPELIGRKSLEKDGFALSDLLLCLHNATHVDAPSHTLSEGAGVADAALSVFFGECVVCRAENAEKEFCGRMLFKDAPPDAALAQRLADRGILLAGTQYPSFDKGESLEVHRIFARAGAFLLENLKLEKVGEGKYILCAFPLKVDGAEASPVRAVLIKGLSDIGL